MFTTCLGSGGGGGGICVDASRRPLYVYVNTGRLVECKGPWTGSQKTRILVSRLPLTQHVILEQSHFFAIPKMRALV